MAHSEFSCCAVCDREMNYMGLSQHGKHKDQICASCLWRLASKGVVVRSVEDLLSWIRESSKAVVLDTLCSVGFSFCRYPSSVDDAVHRKMDL